MYKILSLFLLLLFAAPSFSQPAGYTKLSEAADLRDGLQTASKNTNSLSSNFTQIKKMNLLDEEVSSFGVFKFKKERKVRMEYTRPFNYLLVINDSKIQIKDRQKTNSFSSSSNKLFSSINNIMIDCMTGKVLDNDEFKSLSFNGRNDYLIEMYPVKKELKDFFEKINVYIDKVDFSVMKIEMLESMGDVTTITFTDKKINIPVDEKEFTIP